VSHVDDVQQQIQRMFEPARAFELLTGERNTAINAVRILRSSSQAGGCGVFVSSQRRDRLVNAATGPHSTRLRRESSRSLDRILLDDVRDPGLNLLTIDVIRTRRKNGCLSRRLGEYRARHVAHIHLHFSR
jgi:hypothetical protein